MQFLFTQTILHSLHYAVSGETAAVYEKLAGTDQAEFIQQHKVINKLHFAEEHGVNVPELYYLLQPMYNDSLHLGGDNNAVARKMKSCYLKTNNLHVRRMVQMLFE